MRRLTAWAGLLCGLALILFFYRAVLFQGEQFGFRDSAHYYYPLYHKVQQEWNAGRWPLWDPSENAGMPLLGNPTAAVLYPLKVIYGIFSYPWAARLYVVAHTALAFAGMIVLLRSWGTSWVGSMIAGLSYAFGGPVVFQYCNIIFLVGATWVPWGILAIDGWVRLKTPRSIALLAVVLAMQVLGGDPESAYLMGLCAGGYAIGLTWVDRFGPWRVKLRKWLPLVVLAVVGWVVITVILAADLPGFRPEPRDKDNIWGPVLRWFSTGQLPVFQKSLYDGPVPSLPWTRWVPRVVAAFWAVGAGVFAYRWWNRGTRSRPLVPLLAGLAASAILAGGLSAAQMVPAMEFTGLSSRATDESGHDMYPFSLEPYRLVEAFVPGVYGRRFGRPVMWVDMILPELTHRVWIPSLYIGGLTALLGLSALGFRNGPPWRAWMTGIVAISLIGSFGEFSSPIVYARMVPKLATAIGYKGTLPALFTQIGPLDSLQTNAVRLDGFLRNGDGSPYFLMSELLPGFSQFRFPSKLLTFTALALAALGGLGWDRAISGRSRRVPWFAIGGSIVSLAGLALVFARQGWITRQFESSQPLTLFGRIDIPGVILDMKLGFLQCAVVLAATGFLILIARRSNSKLVEREDQAVRSTLVADLAGLLAVLLLAVDLALANSDLIQTVPQSDFEFTPKVLKLIDEAEKLNPSPGPFRIHRMPIWNPMIWRTQNSVDRVRDFVVWEHDTLQPKYGLLHGIEYTQSIGVAELYDHAWFFAPFPRALRAEAAKLLGINTGDKVVIYPRRGFDLWNSRYFVLPAVPRWDDVDRGTAAFLPQTERIYPSDEISLSDPKSPMLKHWAEEEDFQILRNNAAYPRAWLVHDLLFRKPVVGLTRDTRRETMEEILYPADLFWTGPEWTFRDLRKAAFIEATLDQEPELKKFRSDTPPQPGETVKVVTEASGPQRVVLDVSLKLPRIVVLADIFYPGWKLTIDGQPAPIWRVNRAMRGAAVQPGSHRLVYTYEPRSFRIGAVLTLLSIVGLVGFVGWSFRSGMTRPRILGYDIVSRKPSSSTG